MKPLILILFTFLVLVSSDDPFSVGQHVDCVYASIGVFNCEGITFENQEEEADVVGSPEFWSDLCISIILLISAGIAFGLAMGLLSLDKRNLKILKRSNSIDGKYASQVYPLVKRHHLLLVTLFLAFVASVESIPLFLRHLVPNSYVTLAISIPTVLFFGQIIPGAICTRWKLEVGYYAHPLVWALIIILSPIAFPISKILDVAFGDDTGSFYRRDEIKELVKAYTENELEPDEDNRGEIDEMNEGVQARLSPDEVKLIVAALNMKEMFVKTKMLELSKVFMIPDDAKLGTDLMRQIQDSGHSRVPIYHGKRDFIIGIILVSQLIAINPTDNIPVDSLEVLQVPLVASNMSLYSMLDRFKKGRTQMAIVLDDKDNLTPVGIITMEDVLEALLDTELFDEKDTLKEQGILGKDPKPIPRRHSGLPPREDSLLKFLKKKPGTIAINVNRAYDEDDEFISGFSVDVGSKYKHSHDTTHMTESVGHSYRTKYKDPGVHNIN